MKRLYALAFAALLGSCAEPTQESFWSIGTADSSASEFALAPSGYKDFLANDFGYEDRYFLVGHSDLKTDFPYVLPGPKDQWGGTWVTSGWRTHDINILFDVDKKGSGDFWQLEVGVVDNAVENPPLVKVTFNGKDHKFLLEKGGNEKSLEGDTAGANNQTLSIPIATDLIKEGGNRITISVLEGSWVVFDNVTMKAPSNAKLGTSDKVFVENVAAADYQIDGKQPLLVTLEHLKGNPTIEVEVDSEVVLSQKLDTAHYTLEALMPAVKAATTSDYEITVDGKTIQEGTVARDIQREQTPADYVDTRIGTAHSRWMIAPGPWMPFSMVKISPDNQNGGWQAGYQPTFESVGCFSHIHEWTMGGLGMMATNGKLITEIGDEADPDSGYRSRINKSTEKAPLGYYSIVLEDYGIKAEMSATTRCSFQKYTFPADKEGARILLDLQIPTEYAYDLKNVELKWVDDKTLEGKSHQFSAGVWSSDAEQDYTIHFIIEFDQPSIKRGGWLGDKPLTGELVKGRNLSDAGAWAEFDPTKTPVVQARVGMSLVSLENAKENLAAEMTPFGWSLDKVVENQKNVWNDLLERVDITTNDRFEKVRFYSNMYRAICSRNTWSDVNGEWISTDGKTRKLAGKNDVALGCDAFWNTFWNLNQFWNLVTPEWSSKWVGSQLAMYDANGWLSKGPAGMNYIPVMVAEHEIPLIVGAYQMGIRDFDAQKALEASVKMQTTPSRKLHTGYVGNRDLIPYLKYGYVPSDLGRFSNSLEYSYDDWTIAQFAKALGDEKTYQTFAKRGEWWKNAINQDGGYAHLRDSKGEWMKDFDPFKSGANHHYVEGNSWQLTFFVPQDVPALADYIGKDNFIERLNWGFEASEPWRFNAPNDQYWDYPAVQGNQQSMHFAFLFNWVGKPWLTQKWSRSIIDRYYGAGSANAYLGDEDQGQMSGWFVMAALGLFQTDGGCSVDPVYEIASPLYEKVVIDLGKQYGRGESFTIEAKGASRTNKYVQSAMLNGKELTSFKFPASELLKGGSLVLEMGSEPNKNWGIN